MVPREWIAPPDYETAEGELYNDDEEDDSHERSRMLSRTDTSFQRRTSVDIGDDEWDSEDEHRQGTGKEPVRDTSGRVVPPSERAPTRKAKMSDYPTD